MLDRRTFLAASAASVAAWAAPRAVEAAWRGKAYKVGVIGTGWFGMVNCRRLLEVAPEVQVTALCDVCPRMLAKAVGEVEAKGQKEKPRTFTDYRDMLKSEKLDIVIVGSPDHWHALHTIAAMEAGADVYCEKPTSKDVAEGQAMVAVARKLGRIVQLGTQRRSTPHILQAKEFLQSGKLGQIGQVHAYCYYHMRANTNPPESPIPEGFNYDLWCGPAPKRPFTKLIHPRSWRAFMEYGNGIIGDMGVHMLDTARFLLDRGWPKTIVSNGGIYVQKNSAANISDTQTAVYDYGDLLMTWEHRTWGRAPDQTYQWGVDFIGEKGTLKVSTKSFDFFPNGATKPSVHVDAVAVPGDTDQGSDPFKPNPVKPKDDFTPANQAQMRNFLECIVSRGKPVADVEEVHISTAMCILGNISQQLGGRTLRWDPNKHVVVGDAEATRMLKLPYREPWKHPADA